MLSHIHVMGICLYKTMAAESPRKSTSRVVLMGTWFYWVFLKRQTERKRLLHVLLICRRSGYWNWDLKSGVLRDFIFASIKILVI